MDKTQCFRIIRGSFIGNGIRKEKHEKMNSQTLKNQKKLWGEIWRESVHHNSDVKWLKDLQREVNVTKQEKVDITKEGLKKIFGKMPKWKSPGPGLVQGI